MYKVRIKTSPNGGTQQSTGDQNEYGLVRNLTAMQSSPQTVAVNNKMGAIPREYANIEVEGGESVIGDVNQDGNMELMHFVGKRHNEGGVPVNIPEGSFIFSDTKSLIIKDREVIEQLFNLSFKKQGYTPAEISKKYDINSYMEILKDENADAMSKRSAAEMLKKNKQKLGILAFIQESMKGFPDGIPAIAEEVLATMGIDPNQIIQQAASPQPEQGMMPPMESQGIPMSEDEDAMAGMMPEGPMVAPDQIPEQMMGKFGGQLPSYELAGNVVKNKNWDKLSNEEKGVLYRISSMGYNDVTPIDNGKFYYRQGPDDRSFKEVSFTDWPSIKSLYENRVEPPGLPSGKIFTYEGRPDTYYKTDENGKVLIKNKDTGWKYVEMNDPTGERLKNLTSGLLTGYTKEYKKQPKRSESIPGFGSKSALESYMSDNAEQYAAGDTFYKALKSKDPAQMLSAAEEIKKIDVPWSVGWLPFTDQDKIDDMYGILHEEALKGLNEQQKIILKNAYDTNTVKNRVKNVIDFYEKKLNEATNASDKIKISKKLRDYVEFQKEFLESGKYDSWYKGTQKSKVKPNSSSWFDSYDLGNPIQDVAFSRFNDESLMSVLENVTKEYDKINKTNIATVNPLAFKGQSRSGGSGRGDTISFGSETDSFETYDTEGKVKDVYNKLYRNDNTPSKSKNYKPEYKIEQTPYSIYRVDTDSETGSPVWMEYTSDGAEMAVSDSNIVKELNRQATLKTGKAHAIKPAPSMNTGSIVDVLNEQANISPQPSQSTVAPVQPQRSGAPAQRQATPARTQDAPKFTNGLTDNDFNFEVGGTVGEMMDIDGKMYKYGGSIDERGYLSYSRGGSVLPKYSGGGTPGAGDPPKEEPTGKEGTINGVDVVYYKQTIPDPNGGEPTIINVIRKKSDNSIYGRKNMTTGEAINDPNAVITRASTEWVTPENLNDWEREQANFKWNGNVQAYVDHLNFSNQIRLDKRFRDAIVKQFKEDVKDPNYGMYSGEKLDDRKKYASKYEKEVLALANSDDPDAIIRTMIDFEERNARLAAFGMGEVVDQNIAAKTTGNKTYQGDYVNETARKLIEANPGLRDMKFDKNYLGQATYISLRRAAERNPEFADRLAVDPTGQGDETIFGLKGKISGIDNYSTDTTLRERARYKLKPPQPQVKPGQKQAYYCVEYSDGTKAVETVGYNEDEKPVKPSGGNKVNATLYETLELANANCAGIKKPEDIIAKPNVPNLGPWFTPDVINLATGIRQRIPHPSAVMRQMPQIYSGYDLDNPITQIAAATSLARQKQDLAMNTMDPTVAAAVNAGEGYVPLTEGISNISKNNLNTTNAYLARIGALQSQYDAANMQGQRQFDVDYEVGKEEFARDLNKYDAQNAMLYNTGWGNVFKDEGFKLADPQAYHANRITPYYQWSGVGRDPLGADTYVSKTGSSGTDNDCSKVYAQAYAQVKNEPSMDDAAKRKYAESMMNQCISANKTSKSNAKTSQQSYVSNANSLFGEFGGTYTAPGSYEFGGTYFDDF